MSNTTIFLQDACLQHKYIRDKDISNVVERPERLRAVNVGIAAAVALLETVLTVDSGRRPNQEEELSVQDLTQVMEKLEIGNTKVTFDTPATKIIPSQAKVDILNNPAVKFVHGDIQGDTYLESLKRWIAESRDKIVKDGSEIPKNLSQGDLYLCPDSINAIEGALGTVCEAVDTVMSAENASKRAFTAIRPPGHHCGEDTPSGFCFVNNVIVGAAHAHLKHNIDRIVIFDIDLHHGNGTQSIVWSINEETHLQALRSEAGAPAPAKLGPRIYYGSLHDILSYPCEDGDLSLVQAASVSLHNAHGQFIENIHLQEYKSEEYFWNVLYQEHYSRLIRKAENFVENTGGPGSDVLVFISCGMDACEHEYASMSRHNRKVPTSFYYRFARDASIFSDKYASGSLVSVLEGGYSDRALISGTIAHICGLVGSEKTDEKWWSIGNLIELENATKRRKGGRPSVNPDHNSDASVIDTPEWLKRTVTIFNSINGTQNRSTRSSAPVSSSSRTLRERTKLNQHGGERPTAEGQTKKGPRKSTGNTKVAKKPRSSNVALVSTTSNDQRPWTSDKKSVLATPIAQNPPVKENATDSSLTDGSEPEEPVELLPQKEQKKLPRIVLKLGQPPVDDDK